MMEGKGGIRIYYLCSTLYHACMTKNLVKVKGKVVVENQTANETACSFPFLSLPPL